MKSIARLHPASKHKLPYPASIAVKRSLQILSAIVGCTFIGFTSAAMAQIVLKQGDTGTAVSNLQDRLRALGCYDGATTEFFGEQTRDAVIRCQQQQGITADGIVGAETYRVLGLGNPAAGTGSVQYGDRLQLDDRGPGVRDLQTQLQAKGYYYGAIDGIFGTDTQTAVIQLQRDLNRPQTGVVDDNVYAALSGSISSGSISPSPLPSGTTALQFGEQNSRVTDLQQQLSRLGYSVPPTGYYGTQTQQAVANFQQSQSLPPTGTADIQTLTLIRNAAVGGDTTVSQNSRSYVVIIPIPDRTALNRVQDFVPDAVPRQSRLGNFVRVGAYTTPEAAERQAEAFRSRGLRDTRVVFE